MIETWLPIPGFPGYEASNMGQIRSLKGLNPPHTLKPSKDNGGYLGVNLCTNGLVSRKNVHQLIMLAFVGSCPEGLEVCHNDGSRANNRLSNLRYDTHQANMRETKRANGPYSLNGIGRKYERTKKNTGAQVPVGK